MFSIHDPHQFFETDDDDGQIICRWTMDRIKRSDGPVWVMNHFFINPKFDLSKALAAEMPTALYIAQKSGYPIWPLDPAVIKFFSEHAAYQKVWYHRPFQS